MREDYSPYTGGGHLRAVLGDRLMVWMRRPAPACSEGDRVEVAYQPVSGDNIAVSVKRNPR